MASAEHVPQGFCIECGCVLDLQGAAELRISDLKAELEQTRELLAIAERDRTFKVRELQRLKAEQNKQARRDPLYPAVEKVLLHWQEACSPNAREPLGTGRYEACLSRLRACIKTGMTELDAVEELKRCVDGYALKPYVTDRGRSHIGSPSDRRVDAELIFRDDKHVQQGLSIAEHADDLRQVMAPEPSSAPLPASDPQVGDIGRTALKMARHGFHVFPIEPRGKRPVTKNGLLDAKRDPSAIAQHWSKYPQHNVAVRTGRESGIVVLDVDGEEGWESLIALEKERGEMPDTLSVKTPRGGHHFYFTHPGREIRNTTGFPRPFLDIRGDGGYVLAPPSVGPDGRIYAVDEELGIAPMPRWLLDLLLEHQEQKAATFGNARDWALFISEGAAEGQRDNRMTQYVGHMFAHGHDAGEVFAAAKLLNIRVSPALPEKDLERITKSIARAHARTG